MAIRIQCECGKALKAPDSVAGKKAKCPFCQRTMVVLQLGSLLEALPDVKLPLEHTQLASASFAPKSDAQQRKRLMLWLGIPTGAVLVLLLYLGISATLRPGSRRSTADVAKPPPTQPSTLEATSLPPKNGRQAAPTAEDESVPESMIRDYARVIGREVHEQISTVQRDALGKHGTPIVVITIKRMADFGHDGSIETMATEWFNELGIGTLSMDGGNRGMLVLVSTEDRKARIELGADWGRGWDAHCKVVMDQQMIPEFRQGDYGQGIADGVDALAGMARRGPQDAPASQSAMRNRLWGALKGENGGIGSFSPFPVIVVWLALIAGVCMIVAAFVLADDAKPLLWGGLATIGLGLATFYVLIGLAVLGMGRAAHRDSHLWDHDSGSSWGLFGGGSWGDSGGDGFGGGLGGGFGGGFSGGGGASGSW